MLKQLIHPQMDPEEVKKLVIDSLGDAEVEVYTEEHNDDRSEGAHFSIRVVSPEFQGESRVERHRMVQKALGDSLGNEIHAVEISALTPEET